MNVQTIGSALAGIPEFIWDHRWVLGNMLSYLRDKGWLVLLGMLVACVLSAGLGLLIATRPALYHGFLVIVRVAYSPFITVLAVLLILAELDARAVLPALTVYLTVFLLRHGVPVLRQVIVDENLTESTEGVGAMVATAIRHALPDLARVVVMAFTAVIWISAIPAYIAVSGAEKNFDVSYFDTHRSDVFGHVREHVLLTLKVLGIALLVALPLGTLLARIRWLYTPAIAALGVIYTIPSLALLALLVPVLGTGDTNALVVLVAYAQFILVRNVAVGIRGVDPTVIDAARGMGMNGMQILFKIEYPLALPVILAGLRVATVATIAIATIAYEVSVADLGQLLFDGINLNYSSEILVGAIAVSLLALAADLLLRLVEALVPFILSLLATIGDTVGPYLKRSRQPASVVSATRR